MNCILCENPYPYMCNECQDEDVGPASSRQHIPAASMGKEFLRSINKKAEAQEVKINIASGEDAGITIIAN